MEPSLQKGFNDVISCLMEAIKTFLKFVFVNSEGNEENNQQEYIF